MSRPLFVQFGAGNIGRSLVGAIFSRAGYDVLFVDAAPALVEGLHARRGYRVVIKDELPPGVASELDIAHVDAVAASNISAVADAVRRADLMGTAVGAHVLPAVLESLAAGLAQRQRPVSILFCENLHGVAERARQALTKLLPPGFPLAERIGLVATSIGKMVPLMPAEVRQRDPLEVWGEAYNVIVADRAAFVGPPPEIEGLELRDCFAAYVDRKLFVHNLGHAVCAYHGFLHGCTRIAEAMEQPEVARQTRTAMESSARALISRYPTEFEAQAQQAHVEDLLRRFGNTALGDTVFRVGRDLPRKLAPEDRFIGALRQVLAGGSAPDAICRGIAAALHFRAADETGQIFAADAAFLDRLAHEGVRGLLAAHCHLEPAHDAALLNRIEADYATLKESGIRGQRARVQA